MWYIIYMCIYTYTCIIITITLILLVYLILNKNKSTPEGFIFLLPRILWVEGGKTVVVIINGEAQEHKKSVSNKTQSPFSKIKTKRCFVSANNFEEKCE